MPPISGYTSRPLFHPKFRHIHSFDLTKSLGKRQLFGDNQNTIIISKLQDILSSGSVYFIGLPPYPG